MKAAGDVGHPRPRGGDRVIDRQGYGKGDFHGRTMTNLKVGNRNEPAYSEMFSQVYSNAQRYMH